MQGRFRFGRFVLDAGDRQLRADDGPVELNARYLDALMLLVRESGKLVSKDRFNEEVWRGVPVTDEALTQCIRTLRRHLGDSAGAPQFIETVPKHGYRFIAQVEPVQPVAEPGAIATSPAGPSIGGWREFVRLGIAGTIGAAMAGLVGGLIYGFVVAAQLEPGTGAASVLIVLLCLCVMVALVGGAGVAFGVASETFATSNRGVWSVIGGASGGLLVGAVVKLLGLDAFNLLFGQSPGDVAGAAEGALLGGAAGLGAWISGRNVSVRRSVAVAALAGGGAGVVLPLIEGRLMAGSLASLAEQFPNSRLRVDQIGSLLGETGFGPISQMVTSGLEGALFAGCIVGAIAVAKRRPRRR